MEVLVYLVMSLPPEFCLSGFITPSKDTHDVLPSLVCGGGTGFAEVPIGIDEGRGHGRRQTMLQGHRQIGNIEMVPVTWFIPFAFSLGEVGMMIPRPVSTLWAVMQQRGSIADLGVCRTSDGSGVTTVHPGRQCCILFLHVP